jgi:transcription elongation factor Elf1
MTEVIVKKTHEVTDDEWQAITNGFNAEFEREKKAEELAAYYRCNIKGLAKAVSSVLEKGKSQYQIVCRHRALKYFNKDDRYSDYLKLYEKLLAKPAVKQ